MEYQHKRKGFGLPKAIFIFCIIISILFIVGFSRELINRHEIDKQVKSLDKQISDLQSQNQELNTILGSLQGNEFIEKEARLKLGLQKPGEKVAMIKRDQRATTSGSALADGSEISGSLVVNNNQNIKPNPVKWWHYFFK